jgi:hypothetical protein
MAGVAATAGVAQAAPLAPKVAGPGVVPSRSGAGLLGAPTAPSAPAHAATPSAISDRIASRTRYRDMSDARAVALGRDVFPELIGRDGWRPLALPQGGRILDYADGDRTARLVDGAGKRVLMTSDAPLRATDADTGLPAPVDLGLERQGDGYVPSASTTDIALAADPSGGITVGDVSIALAGAAASTPAQVDDTLVWPNAITDGDVAAQVLPGGVELSLTLRSADSPTDVPFTLDLPSGTALRNAPLGSPEAGGLQVVDGSGRVRTTISSPAAWDADHVSVPSRWTVDGTTATLHVDSAGADVAYPVAVDPVVNDERYYCDLANRPWTAYTATAYGVSSHVGDNGWGCGVFQYLNSYVYLPDGAFSWWELNLGGRPTANIRQVHAENMNHDTGANAIGGPATCTFLNVWYTDTATEYPWGTNSRCDTYRGVVQNIGDWTQDNGIRGDKALIGLHTAGAGTRGYFQQSVGVLVAALGDYGLPTATLSPGSGPWQRATSMTYTPGGSDTGLGITRLQMDVNGATQTASGFCTPSTVICNPSASATMTFSGLPEGVTQATATAYDPVGQFSQAIVFTSVDTSSPGLTLSGAAYNARNTTVDAGTYALTIAATDGSGASNATKRSGVASVTTFVDGVQVDQATQSCGGGSCALNRTWNFQPGLYGPGAHTIKVVAQDVAGNPPTQTSFTVTADCCFRTPTRWNATSTSGDVGFGDVNGDDFDDVVLRNTTTGAVTVELSNGTALANPVAWGTWPTARDFNVYDMDGDGRADLVGRDSAGTVFQALSSGTAFGTSATLTTLATTYNIMRVGDVNGDQLGDVVGESSSAGTTQIVLTDGTVATDRLAGGSWPAGYTFILRDVDGDGVDDAVGRNATSGDVRVGFSTDTAFATRGGPWSIPANADFTIADVTGDGLTDIVYRASGSDLVYVRDAVNDNSGTTFLGAQVWGRWPATRAIATADVTGDDLNDLVARDSSDGGFWVSISQGQSPQGESSNGDAMPSAAAAAPLSAAVATTCQATSGTKLAVGDDGRFLYNDVPDAAGAAQRAAALGAEVVRLTVYWGQLEISPGNYAWTRLDDTISKIRATHVGNDPNCPPLQVHVTLTGQVGRVRHDAFNANSRDALTGPSTGVRPDPALFARFVKDVVKRYDGQVGSYSIWNEPNLPTHYFLATALKSNGVPVRELTAKLYRSLYVAANAAAQQGYCELHACNPATNPLPVLIGELSEQRTHDKVVGGVAAHAGGFSALDYLYEVVRPTSTDPAVSPPIIASGVALHPYQHTYQASDRGTPGDVGLGKLTATLLPTSGKSAANNRVGVLAALSSLSTLTGPTGSGAGPAWLRTPAGQAAPLYLNEFGYLNLAPGKERTNAALRNKSASWYSESARAVRYAGDSTHKGALEVAFRAHPRWLTLWGLTESGVRDPATGRWNGPFDTGLIAPAIDASWLDVKGSRPYGRPSSRSVVTNVAQTRRSYCAIYAWMASHGGPVQTGVPCP